MILQVIVDISTNDVDRAFDYEGEDMPIGSRVAVDFGNQRLIGFVIGKKEQSEYPNLKIAKYLDTPISSEQLELLYFMREAYHLRYIDALRLFVPAKLREERDPEFTRAFMRIDDERSLDELCAAVGKNAKKQLEALKYLASEGGQFLSVMTAKFGVSAIKGLRDKNVVIMSAVHERSAPMNTLSKSK